MQRYSVPHAEALDDVLADDGHLAAEIALPPADAVPEDARSEIDREARLAEAERELELTEGQRVAAADLTH